MKRNSFFLFLIVLFSASAWAEKKPLDHSVYDSWESISQILVSNDGRYAVHLVAPQSGDTVMYVTNLKTLMSVCIDRGFSPQITDDSRYVVFRIKPTHAEKKAAKKAKKKMEEQPKDSLGWLKLGTDHIVKIPDVKSYKMPEKSSNYFAFTALMPKDTAKQGKEEKPEFLIVKDIVSGTDDTIPYVSNYVVSKNGKYLVYLTKPLKKDSVAVPEVCLYEPAIHKKTRLMAGKGDYKLQSFDEEATQFSFFATTDTTKRDPKVYNLYYTRTDSPLVRIIADTLSKQMPTNWAVNSFRNVTYSRDGKKLYFGISPIVEPKDTTIDLSEKAQLDIWNYQDDYLQPTQLLRKNAEQNRSYLCVFHTDDMARFVQLGGEDLEEVYPVGRGNSDVALGLTNKGYRIESQWVGYSRNDVYVVSVKTGERTLVGKGMTSRPAMSATGKYLTWYDRDAAQWYLYSIADKTTRCITGGLGVRFDDDRRETPERPGSFGSMGWAKDDRYFYLYDMYDIWQIDPTGKVKPTMVTKGAGRKAGITFRNIRLDNEIDYIDTSRPLLLSAFDNKTKEAGYYTLSLLKKTDLRLREMDKKTYPSLRKAKNADVFVFSKSDFATPSDLWVTADWWKTEKQISHINSQIGDYLWGTVELISWTSKDGIDTEGLLYKPENFDPNRKYPMMIYFYEKHSDELYRHYSVAPSRSIINIPFFVSRGYLVFVPDIHYIDGHPGRSAYNSIVAGAEKLCENAWVDRDHIAIQGQSWGGYQVAYLITQTDMFAAAGAGAPVANMTSAYGGIRWGSGVTRQMQYERQQSRIGKTLWEGLDLYIENSPLFFADKVNTPLLIMHNDKDGAVPWYQGIEYFTALKRLGKVVYMLQYNGEEHNLVQRRNTVDLSIRLQQFFDHYLKGAPMPVWMKKGVPATEKGRTWGLEIE